MSATGASNRSFCGECGAVIEAGEAFCGSCGAARDPEPAAAPAPEVQPPPAPARDAASDAKPEVVTPATPAVRPKKKRTFLKVALAAVLGLFVIAGGFFLFTSGVLRPGKEKHAPSMPKTMAGILTEFPIDGTDANRAKPTNVKTQALNPGQSPKLASYLPVEVTPEILTRLGKSISSAQYKARPEDTPVNVDVIDTRGSSAEAARTLANIFAASIPGSAVSGVRLQGLAGAQYSGYKIKSAQAQVYVYAKADAPIVVVIYAPDAATLPLSDRLARSVGNGGGLAADAEATDVMWLLPQSLPDGIELVDMQTYNAADLASVSQIVGSLDQQAGGSNELATQVRRVLPDRLVSGRYRDGAGGTFTLLVGDYGNTFSAWKTWLQLRALAGLSNMKSVDVHNTTGLRASDGHQQFLIFQSGPYIAVVAGSAVSDNARILQLAEALQF